MMSIAAVTILLAAPGGLLAAPPDDGRRTVREQGLSAAVTPRTPEQLAAFYSARGFPAGAVEHISRRCFITVSLVNDSGRVLWLEPGEWQMQDAEGRAVRRVARPDWEALWERIRLPAANRATFGWTLLPESRDLQPGETVGGNLTLHPPDGEFTITLRFLVGQDRQGGVFSFRLPRLRCAPAETAS